MKRYDDPPATARAAVAALTTYSLNPQRRATECDLCGAVLADRRDLWHFGSRVEVCAACRDAVIAGPLGQGAPLDRLSTCEPFPSAYIVDLRHLAPGWAA